MDTIVQTRSDPIRLVVVSAGVSDPSTTRMVADQVAQKALDRVAAAGLNPVLSAFDLAPLAADIGRAAIAGFPASKVQAVIDSLAVADAIVVATPVYKAGMSGLFKLFLDILDNDLLIAKPIVLVATAGTARHAMVPDEQMRPLFAFMRTVPMPTSIFAAPEDWGSPELGARIDRAAIELTQFLVSGLGNAIADAAWGGYNHQFGGNATRAERAADDIDLDSDLMRLATGGAMRPD